MGKIEETQEMLENQQNWAKKSVAEARKKFFKARREFLLMKKKREEDLTKKMTRDEREILEMYIKKRRALGNVLAHAQGSKDYADEIEKCNSELRAELEAIKLNISENERIQKDAEEKGKKSLKKIKALEKQCNKLQLNVEEAKSKCMKLEQENEDIQNAVDEILKVCI